MEDYLAQSLFVGLQSIVKQVTTPKMRQPLAKYVYLLTSPTLIIGPNQLGNLHPFSCIIRQFQ